MSVPGPRRAAPAARLAGVALLALSSLLLPGCDRQPRLVPAGADSTRLSPQDSLAEQVRTIQERWETGADGEEAARLTAALLLGDLRARLALEPLAPWEPRARALLDSLGIGAEVAGAPCAMVVNLFSRSNPAAGSWPWAYWCGADGVTAQRVEGAGGNLLAVAARGLHGDPPVPPGPAGIAALFARRGGGGARPLLYAWRTAGTRLELAQTLGPDSLGGVGTGQFQVEGDSLVVLTTRTWRASPRFDECASCPHVTWEHRFRWGGTGFTRRSDHAVSSTYGAFVAFIQALMAGDRDAAARLVARPELVEMARDADFAIPRGPWRAAPGSEEDALEMVFYRGATEAWKVGFVRFGDEWRIDSLEPTSRAIE